ncbi:NAD(+) kinase [Kangiella spongicola]|uniref:NAD kinase n=1 Tax=Kangiella spongicola TaxID=796379 RepID=A0A318D8J5_9GAMM|nr:NAD(+) kinase [Kangiella spongicola]PXF64108.1 NAD(+) kinase [Kangiella spongicola]
MAPALSFKTIGIMGKPKHKEVGETIMTLYRHLLDQGYQPLVEDSVASDLDVKADHQATWQTIGENANLVIVVGGDGSMLYAARLMASYNIPLLGVNRGYLGFLTDIQPQQVTEKVSEVLSGEYTQERRFLLEADIDGENNKERYSDALNDIVLYPGEISRMIEFEVYINDSFVYSLRGDGLIISTPTGSTAYALSAGGPIMSPSINAISLVPMFPHTLSSRPISIDAESKVDIVFSQANENEARLSCDGQVRFPVAPGEKICIRKRKEDLWLLHPRDYDYFSLLRTKLGWGSKL